MGTFYLQFLPTPEPYAMLILFPAWLAYCFRYVQSPTSENWIAAALLAIAAMGVHPEFLLLVPYSISIVFIISMFFMARHDKIKTSALAAFIFISAAIIAYLIVNPIGKEYLKDGWVVFDKKDVLRQLLKKAWIISPNLYAVHPRFLLTPESLKNVISGIVITLFIWFQPRLSIEKISKEDTDSSVSMPQKIVQRRLAIAVAAVFAGPYLILYNPVLVPVIVTILGSAIPIRLIEGSYEVFVLVCKFGAIASVIILMLRSNRLYKYGKILKLILLFFILTVGIGWSVGRPPVRSLILGMIYRDPSVVSILDLTKDTLFKGLSKLEPGIVAIDMKLSEYLVMTTPHHVVSATRATKERQLDNEKIVKFSVSTKVMKELITKYNFHYVVVPLDGKLVLNGEFSTGTSDWDAVGMVASESRGHNGKCLQLMGTGNGMPFVYQNVTLDVDKYYKLHGYVKSGTSGYEPFAIQIYQHNASGHGEFSVDGVTTDSWRGYSMVFRANYRELSILLRKMSSTPGTMLFDSISLYEVVPLYPSEWENRKNKNGGPLTNNRGFNSTDFIPYSPLHRFREHPELFYEILTLEKYAVFKVKNG